MNPSPNCQRSAVPDIYGWCLYCGNSDPRDPFVHYYGEDGFVYRLCCSDAAACQARQNAEATWAETRFEITDAGRAALAAAEGLAPRG